MRRLVLTITVFTSVLFTGSHADAAGVVLPGTTQLADAGTSGSPAQWWLEGDYASPAGSFTIGGSALSFNQLSVTTNQTFTTSGDFIVGPNRSSNNRLDILAGGEVSVNGNFRSGQGSISYYSQHNRTTVSGLASFLAVTDTIYMGNGTTWTSTNNILNISNGGIVVVDSDKNGTGGLSLLNHWSYGNSWLELNGGQLFWYGDKTASFGQGMLSSIKVWDEATSSLQRVAYYSSTTWYSTQYLDLLEITYIADAAMAADLGVSQEYIGFTVVQNIPEPATVSLLVLGLILVRRQRKTIL